MKTNKPLHLTLREAVRKQINKCEECLIPGSGIGEQFVNQGTWTDCKSCNGKGYIQPCNKCGSKGYTLRPIPCPDNKPGCLVFHQEKVRCDYSEPLKERELLLAIQNSKQSQQANRREVEFRYKSYNQEEDEKNVLYIEVSDYVQGGDEPEECWDSWDITLDLTKDVKDQDEETLQALIKLFV